MRTFDSVKFKYFNWPFKSIKSFRSNSQSIRVKDVKLLILVITSNLNEEKMYILTCSDSSCLILLILIGSAAWNLPQLWLDNLKCFILFFEFISKVNLQIPPIESFSIDVDSVINPKGQPFAVPKGESFI